MRLFLAFFMSCGLVGAQHLACDSRTPEGHAPEKRPGDGGFRIIVVGPNVNVTSGFYSPNQVYTESEKQALMGPSGLVTTGIFHIIDDTKTRFSDTCPDGVASYNRQPKSEISVLWTAPSVLIASCITFKATVVERPHVWYMDSGGLTKTLCPEPRRPTAPIPQRLPNQNQNQASSSTKAVLRHQALPPPTFPPFPSPFQTTAGAPPTFAGDGKCCACDDAKYDITFEGIWSKETHPKDFPENEWLLHFSDIIGASHSPDYYFWRSGEYASEGIKHVAEWGATRQLENELKGKSEKINTIIKARGLWHPNEKGITSAAFRVDKSHHLISLVSMIGPSPDWIVGISGLELCLPNCTWTDEAKLDLFPYDAGSDSGITYMSPNTPSQPPEKIRPITPTNPDDSRSPFHGVNQMEPFAKVVIRRQRIYPKSCSDNSTTKLLIQENTDDDINRPECAVSEWTTWSDCSVACGKGLRMRKRSYMLPMKADMFRCDRQLVEKEMCLGILPTCPDDEAEQPNSICSVTPWSDWSSCVPCGEGTRSRSRRYKNHMGRKKCNVELVETERCRGPVTCDPSNSTTAPSEQCPFSPWSEWPPCSVTCGKGTQSRSRILIPQDESPLPEVCRSAELSQSRECIGEYGEECVVSVKDATELCNAVPEPGPCRAHKVRYYYNAMKGSCLPFTYGGCKGNRNRFDTPEECKAVCGFLSSESSAPITSVTLTSNQNYLPPPPPPKNNKAPIPIPTVSYFYNNTHNSIAWSTTSTTSAPSTTRTTKVNQSKSIDPVPVPVTFPPIQEITTRRKPTTTPITVQEESEENFNLDLGATPSSRDDSQRNTGLLIDAVETQPQPSPEPLINNPGIGVLTIDSPVIEPVEIVEPLEQIDCVVSAWSDWSPCSVSCGIGSRTRAREVLIEPQNDGRRCPRKMLKKKTCSMPPC